MGDNIKIDLRKIRCDDVHWIYLTQNRDQWWAFANAVFIFRLQKGKEFLD
jgi:hypothetical protein